jgi:hypothetical protein
MEQTIFLDTVATPSYRWKLVLIQNLFCQLLDLREQVVGHFDALGR